MYLIEHYLMRDRIIFKKIEKKKKKAKILNN
jgi:hypothetical protein